jgi:hypothetical protein
MNEKQTPNEPKYKPLWVVPELHQLVKVEAAKQGFSIGELVWKFWNMWTEGEVFGPSEEGSDATPLD